MEIYFIMIYEQSDKAIPKVSETARASASRLESWEKNDLRKIFWIAFLVSVDKSQV